MKEKAIEKLKEAIVAIQLLDMQPESAPGPLQSDAGRAYQALTLAEQALSWLLHP